MQARNPASNKSPRRRPALRVRVWMWRLGWVLALAAGLTVATPQLTAQSPRPQFSDQNLPDGTQGLFYKTKVDISGGVPPYRWKVKVGVLPDGLRLKKLKGKIVGTPTTPGSFTFTIQVKDALGSKRRREFTIAIGDTTELAERISVDSSGVGANSSSGGAAVSADGRFVAFTSLADNLIPNDTNSVADIFLRDRLCGQTVRVSVPAGGGQANSQSFAASVSAVTGGTLFVAYASDASNLVAGDTNKSRDIFVTAIGVSACTLTILDTARVSVATDGTAGNAQSILPTVSADGSHVAYHSTASTLVEGDTNSGDDVFLTDLQFSGGVLAPVRTRRVSLSKLRLAVLPEALPATSADIFSANTIGNSMLSMTTDEHVGRRVEIVAGTGQGQGRPVTANDATTVTVGVNWTTEPDDTSVFRIVDLDGSDQTADIFSANTIGNSALTMTTDEHVNRLLEIAAGTGQDQVRTITANDATTFTVSPDWTTPPDGTSVFRLVLQGNGNSVRGRVSGDGAFVGFNSPAAFVEGDTNFLQDAFIHEQATGATTLTSVGALGALSNGVSQISGVSADAGLVLFHSTATNLVDEDGDGEFDDDTNGVPDLFVHDRGTGETFRVSRADDGSESNGESSVIAGLSGGGRLAAFSSIATNLVGDDRNGVRDVFLRDRMTAQTRRLSLGLGGINPNGESFDAAISLDGTTVAFSSVARNLVLNDTNGLPDVYVAATAISDPPAIVVASLPASRQGSPYSTSVVAVGGTQPLFWTLAEGALPAGLFLDPSTGEISGIPQKAGSYSFTVLVQDADRPTRQGSRTLTLVVKP